MASRNALDPSLAPTDFGQLPESARQALETIGVARRWRAGQLIVGTDEVGSGAFLIRRGRVRLRVLSAFGEERLLARFGSGTLGLLVSALAETRSPCDFVAEVDCDLVHFERSRLTAFLLQDAPASLAIAQVLSARVSGLVRQLALYSFGTLADRVWATLRQLAEAPTPDASGRGPKVVNLTQAAIAEAVGASRYRVGLELNRLSTAGRIRQERGRIVLLAPPSRRPRA